MSAFPLGDLSFLLAIPVVGALALMLVPRRQTQALFFLALIAGLADFVWSLIILSQFDGSKGEMQLVERMPWMPNYGIQYIVGIDGISLFLVLLTTFLMPLAILASWSVKDRVKEYLFFMLLLETGMLGAFIALDLFLFYIFWELMLVAMVLIIGVWGGAKRGYAAVKFFLYTMFGSLVMLVAILYLVVKYRELAGAYSFDLQDINRVALPYPTP